MLDKRIFQGAEVSDACQDRKLFWVTLIVVDYITQRDTILFEMFT